MMGEEYVVEEVTTPLEGLQRSPSRYPQSPNFLPLGAQLLKEVSPPPRGTTDWGLHFKDGDKQAFRGHSRYNWIKQKRPRELSRLFFKEDIQMDYKHMKRCAKSRITRATYVSTAMRCPLSSIKMAAIKGVDVCEGVM